LKIILNGFNGSMGHAIQESVKSNPSIILQNYKDIKDDPGDGVVFIDFSSPDVTEEILDYCNEKLLPLVIGTTGLSKGQQDMLLDLSKDIPILMASNMSMGIAKLKKSILTFIQESNDIFECEITEIHHTKKIDSPSENSSK
jgi:4-hydroxy-tetrahydrodipicolinate reductase